MYLEGIWEASGGIWEASGEYLETRRLREAPTGSGEEKMWFSIVKTTIFVKSLKNVAILRGMFNDYHQKVAVSLEVCVKSSNFTRCF